MVTRQTDTSGDWTSVSDAAARLRLSYNQVLRLVLVGDLRGERRGNRWFVFVAAVEEMRERENTTA